MAEDQEKAPEKGAEEQKKQEKPNKEQQSSKGLLFGILGGVVALNAVIAFLLIQMTAPRDEAQEQAQARADSLKTAQRHTVEVGTITEEAIDAVVNIAGTDGSRFLKVQVRFEYDGKKHPKLGEEIVRRMPKLKDMLIEMLSQVTLEELKEAEAKDKIRKNYMRMVNNSMPPKLGEVRDVLFSQFIIQ